MVKVNDLVNEYRLKGRDDIEEVKDVKHDQKSNNASRGQYYNKISRFDATSRGADGRTSRRSGGLSQSYMTGKSRPVDDAVKIKVNRKRITKKKPLVNNDEELK